MSYLLTLLPSLHFTKFQTHRLSVYIG